MKKMLASTPAGTLSKKRTTTRKAPKKEPVFLVIATATAAPEPAASAMPALLTSISLNTTLEPCFVNIEGYDEAISEDKGGIAAAKRLAITYSRVAGKGVACNPMNAFEIIGFDPKTLTLYARVKQDVPTIALGTGASAKSGIAFGGNLRLTCKSRHSGIPPHLAEAKPVEPVNQNRWLP